MVWMAMTVLAAALVWPVLPAVAQTEAAKVMVEDSDEYGPYLTDADGRALYLFTADQQGSGDKAAQSSCYHACAAAWPPLVTSGEPQAGDEQADKTLIGTIERRSGDMQVTYGGWPLYYFVQDQGPGEATGQDKHGFGGEWYLVTPAGGKVEESS